MFCACSLVYTYMFVGSVCILLTDRDFISLGSINPGLLFESVVHLLNQNNLDLMICFVIMWGNLDLGISKALYYKVVFSAADFTVRVGCSTAKSI